MTSIQSAASRPLLGFVGWSGSGKTTLLKRLIPLLIGRGLRVGVVKHAHHDFDIDHPGKDSYELRKAGAPQVLVASARRYALICERELGHAEPSLDEALSRMDQDRLDLILVEGFKHEGIPKVEVHRPGLGTALLFPADKSIIAVACHGALAEPTALPVLNLDCPDEVLRFVLRWLEQQAARAASAP